MRSWKWDVKRKERHRGRVTSLHRRGVCRCQRGYERAIIAFKNRRRLRNLLKRLALTEE